MGASLTLPEFADERLLPALAHHWQSIRPSAGGLPVRQRFEAFGIAKLLPWVWLFEVHRPPFRFRYRRLGSEHAFLYRFLGQAHAVAMGRENTGLWVDEVRPNLRSEAAYDLFVAVAEEGVAGYYNKGPPTYSVEHGYVGIERLILPLARDGCTVDMLLGITVYFGQGGCRRVDGQDVGTAIEQIFPMDDGGRVRPSLSRNAIRQPPDRIRGIDGAFVEG